MKLLLKAKHSPKLEPNFSYTNIYWGANFIDDYNVKCIDLGKLWTLKRYRCAMQISIKFFTA